MEGETFTMLNEIDVLKTSPSTVKVKVLRVWSIKDKQNVNEDFLMELVIMDQNANRMQATVFKQDIFRFKRFINENSTLTIVNPSVGLNGSNYRVIDCPNKLVLGPNTHVNPCDDFESHMFGFKITSFETIINKQISLNSTIDIIGHVVHVFKPNTSNVKEKNKRTMEICDLRGNCVYLTVWDHYASQLSKYVTENYDEPYAIVLMQFGRVKYFTGADNREKVYVSNSFGTNVSRLFINDYLFEIEEYKNNLLGLLNSNDGTIRKPIPLKMLSSLDDEFLKATSFYNISDICTINSPKSIILLATIKAICPDTEWYYIGCNTCNRKLMEKDAEAGKSYECKNQRCNVLGVIPTPRFKVKIRVQDSTGVVSLTLFDRDTKQLINKTATDLIDPNADKQSNLPSQLSCLLEKKFAFKVDVSDYNLRNNSDEYGISKLTDDSVIIAELLKNLSNIMPSESTSVTPGVSISEFQSADSVSFKISDVGDNETPSSKIKRKLVEVYEDDDQASLSATKFKPVIVDETATNVDNEKCFKFLIPKVEKDST